MGLFRKEEEKYTEEEYNEMRKKLQDMNLSKKEERTIIWSALKTILPGVILVLLAVYGLVYLILLLLR